MFNEEIRKKIIEEQGYTSSVFYTDQSYDNSIIGVDANGKIVYDYDKMIEEFIAENYPPEVIAEEKKKDEHFDEVIASMEWIDYNTVRATPYATSYGIAPVIIEKDVESDDENEYYNLITGDKYNLEDVVYRIEQA